MPHFIPLSCRRNIFCIFILFHYFHKAHMNSDAASDTYRAAFVIQNFDRFFVKETCLAIRDSFSVVRGIPLCASVPKPRVIRHPRAKMMLASKLKDKSEVPPILGTGEVEDWKPWTEVSLAGDLKLVSNEIDLNHQLHAKTDTAFEKTSLSSGPTQATPAQESWRSELFFKSDSSHLFSLHAGRASAQGTEQGFSVEAAELPAAVAADGRSAAEWLIARRAAAVATRSRRSALQPSASRQAVWAEYDPEAIADYYGRRPLAVLFRLTEAGLAFAEWSLPLSPPPPPPPPPPFSVSLSLCQSVSLCLPRSLFLCLSVSQ